MFSTDKPFASRRALALTAGAAALLLALGAAAVARAQIPSNVSAPIVDASSSTRYAGES